MSTISRTRPSGAANETAQAGEGEGGRLQSLYDSFKRSLDDMEQPLSPGWIERNNVSSDELFALVNKIQVMLTLGEGAYAERRYLNKIRSLRAPGATRQGA